MGRYLTVNGGTIGSRGRVVEGLAEDHILSREDTEG
ncbi:hypothetical protein AFERRID_00170 [Acidithiobacillus ferridurans]|uniref:Uncharacterized protein n=1 Tax=Acidithiobacillus ferridurans TaxID=1232575 RepID=A0A2Z6IET0_ACIFI|nr:hypothetical protein AFERRID_00170 [Acidithiobacillus ferridurans]